ncbi:MAG TPA: hypothetical protein VMZ90_11865 [Vicinamibacterales bacterium]|nr:hypothetical protein [Vicinamibacterales bacterium]
MRSVLSVVIVLLAAATPEMALAQPPRPPAVELGVQASKKFVDPTPVTLSPRVTLNLTHLTAIEGTADIRRSFVEPYEGGTRTSSRGLSAHWRQTVFASGRWQVFGVLGAGTNRVEQNYPELVVQGRDGPEVRPAFTFVNTEFVAHLGPAVQVEVAPWLALRGDVRLTVGDNNGGVRGMVGGVIPIGRFRAGDRPARSTPPLAAWQRVKPGREVWVTTNTGSLVHGEIAAITGSTLSVRQQDRDVTINLDDVRFVEGRDSLKNGFFIGAGSGAVAGGLLFGWASSVFCESDSCNSLEAVAVLFGAASGAAVGGLVGAMVDGIIPGRQTLFAGNTIRVMPAMTPTEKALNVTIRWR